VTKSLRVLHLIKGLGRGGAERLVVDQVAFGDRDAFTYDVAYLLPWKNALVAEVERAGASVHCLHTRVERDLRWALRLRRLVRDRNIGLVHVHSPYVAGIARLALRNVHPRVRVAYTLHNRADSHRRSTRMLDARTTRFDDLDFAVCESVRESLPARLRPRFETVLHGVDVDALRGTRAARDEVRAELGVQPDELVVTTVANLRATKDHATLFRAAALVSEQAPITRFLVVGQGPLEHELERLHERLGLGDRVQLLGQRDDVPRVLAASDVFALSSRYEGLPVALMEALALGVPVVATRVGGIPEVVTDGVEGRLVPAEQHALLAGALVELLTDSDRRAAMAEAATARGRQLDVRNAITTIESRYRELVTHDG
jgi:glycosyltransferase involved in cell wall biosynthesis